MPDRGPVLFVDDEASIRQSITGALKDQLLALS